ncbi:MAG: cobyric acid synthase [Acidimicrobiales bacterium]
MTGGALMVCGTSSDVGKTRLVTGLCRALARRGLAVAPFKGQNMALNSVVTPHGEEIGRAQGTQAQAARTGSEAVMNPVLLKPTSERRSQVVVLGRPWKELDAAAFQAVKAELVPVVDGALEDLRARHDVVVCEGAGSPAEVNLFDNDLVNLGLASRAGLPAIVVGDIDRGGVFAHLYGTVALLPEDRRRCVRGFVVNRLRGDPALLGDATDILGQRTGVPTWGVVPYLPGLWLDAEDSLALEQVWSRVASAGASTAILDVAVVRLPRISNFTDLDPLAAEPGVRVRLVEHAAGLGDPDLVVVPGTKSTVADLEWLRAVALDRALTGCLERGSVAVGVCGGYQMFGETIADPGGVESAVPFVSGLGLLPMRTTFRAEKRTVQRRGRVAAGTDAGTAVYGYEIHHGRHDPAPGAPAWFALDPVGPGATGVRRPEPEGVALADGSVYGSALHGLFDDDELRARFLAHVATRRQKEWAPGGASFEGLREAQIDLLADACERALDMTRVLETASDARGAR